MKVSEWCMEIKKCTDSELSQLLGSIENLKCWEAFDKEFGWTGFKSIGTLIQQEISFRRVK